MDEWVEWLRAATTIAYFGGALLALLVGSVSRSGPNYHPALKLAALSMGMQGLAVGFATVVPYFPGARRPPETAVLLFFAVVFGGSAALQLGALRLVLVGNRRWERGERCPYCYGSPPPDDNEAD